MKKTIQITIFLFLLYSTLCCKQEEFKNGINSYNKVATEFSTQIFSDEFYNCSYIIKPNVQNNVLENAGNETLALDYKNILMEILKVSDAETFDNLLDLSKDFDFNDSMFKNGTELIDVNQYIEIRTEIDSIVKYGTQKEIELIFQECPSEFYFVSKPVFDEKFETAVIFIKFGFTCFPASPWIFEYKNGIWKASE